MFSKLSKFNRLLFNSSKIYNKSISKTNIIQNNKNLIRLFANEVYIFYLM